MVMGRHYRELGVFRGGGRNQNTQAGTRVDMSLKDLPRGLMLPCRPTLLMFSHLWNSIARWGIKCSKHRLVVESRFKPVYVPADTVAILRTWCCWDRRLSTNWSPWERKEWSSLPGWVQCLGLVIIHASEGLLLPGSTAKLTPMIALCLPYSVPSETPHRGHWGPHLFLAVTVDGKLLSLSLG